MRAVKWIGLGVVGLLLCRWIQIPAEDAIEGFTSAELPYGFDYSIFLESAKSLLAGENPYDGHPPNLNPPIGVYAFVPMTSLSFADGYRAFSVLSAVCFIGFFLVLLWAYPHQHKPLRVLWLLAIPGIWQTFYLGQIYAPVILMSALAYVLVPQRPVAAGILIGLVAAIKLPFLAWPLYLWIAGNRKTAVLAGITFVPLTLIPLIFSGLDIYSQYATVVQAQNATPNHANSSLAATLQHLGLPDLHKVLTPALVLAGAAFVWKTRPSVETTSGLAIVLTVLASPVAWAGYIPFVAPVLLSRVWHWPERIAAGLMVIPLTLVLDGGLFTLAYTPALLLLAVITVTRPNIRVLAI